VAECNENPRGWWPAYRSCWILNRLDLPDSALVWGSRALDLRPGSSAVLGEFLRAHSASPDSVLKYGDLVSGGGVCRFRLAQAERRLGLEGGHNAYLQSALFQGSDSARADAACWLSMLHPDRSLELMEMAVLLSPGEEFYRTVLAGLYAGEGLAEKGFEVLARVTPEGCYYWQAKARCHEAAGEVSGAAQAYRMAFLSRQSPDFAADLGWFLYRAARDMARRDDCPGAALYLREAAELWHRDSSWAVASESLLTSVNEFLLLESDWERLR
jgi:tetratricopeptide (TPR) repeat protein